MLRLRSILHECLFHSILFYKIFLLTVMKLFHGKQCTSKNRNFSKAVMLDHKVVSALCGDCYSKLHTQLKLLSPKTENFSLQA